MPDEKSKTLEYNPREKSLKAPFSILTDIGSLIPKLPSFQNNPKFFYTDKKAKHIAPDCSCGLIYSFVETINTHNYYRWE